MLFNVGPRILLLAAFFGLLGCHPKAKEITSLQRKEAASLVSEAQFAVTLKDFPRAEELYAKAAALCPDTPDYWVTLGSVRKNLGHIPDARKAYEAGLKSQQDAYARDHKNAQLLIDQIYVLGLLGRPDEARALLKKAQAEHPDDSRILMLSEKGLDQLLASPDFKAMAL
jgi:tetratricopeptide (TPR) repeat protein